MSKIGFPTILHLQTRSLLSILPICSSKLTLTRYSAVKPHIMALISGAGIAYFVGASEFTLVLFNGIRVAQP